jgi:hypothetical protein
MIFITNKSLKAWGVHDDDVVVQAFPIAHVNVESGAA